MASKADDRTASLAGSTDPDDAPDADRARRDRAWRRAGMVFIAAIVVAAAAGLLGQKTSTVTATGGGYRLTVMYPSVVRPGVDVRWNVAVHNDAGFGKTLSIAMTRRTFDDFDINSFRPDPDSSTSTGDQIIYTWNDPVGTEFVFALDAYVEYGEHFGTDASTSVVDARQQPFVTVRYHTRWVP